MQESLLNRLFRLVKRGGQETDAIELLKATPKEVFQNSAVAKGAADVAGSVARTAEAEEETERAEIRAESEFLNEWIGRAETPEEREKVANFKEKWQAFRAERLSNNRRSRSNLLAVSMEVLKLVAVAAAAIALKIFLESRGIEWDGDS